MGLRGGPELVACPTCGRTRIDLVQTAKEVEAALANVDKDIKVAVMGCVVNGPGEAREADIGIAGGDGCAVLFKKGEVLRKIPESEIVTELMKEIEKF
jgi:gcpE protein